MDPIKTGDTGVAVEDIQDRLVSLGYAIAEDERSSSYFGNTTANAVARFRLDHDLDLSKEIDAPTWQVLVDECYQLGDRTLYLRLPNFHGNDVRQLQERLNILGFSCGATDGNYGVFTEAAVKEFQESVGELPDGMCFPGTIDAIERLRHVWAGKPAVGPHPQGGMGFARAADVLENTRLAITGADPIARNVAGRVWNLAGATTEKSGLSLIDSPQAATADIQAILIISSSGTTQRGTRRAATVSLDDPQTLPLRLRTAIQSSRARVPQIRLELPVAAKADGTFTLGDAQTYAVMLLDAICGALENR